MNRTALGLAVGAGYLLGRTKKMKLALAVGAMAAGKKLPLSPGALKDVLTQQMENNPAFKELGTQLRGNLSDAGKAASGALVERQMSSLADRLADRTRAVRDRTAGAQDEAPDDAPDEAAEEAGGAGAREAAGDAEEGTGRGARGKTARAARPAEAARRSSAGRAARATDPARKAAPAKRAPRKAASRRTTERGTAGGGQTGAERSAGKTTASGGGSDRGTTRRGTGGRSDEGRR